MDRLVEGTRGNPLALLEVTSRTSPRRSGSVPPPCRIRSRSGPASGWCTRRCWRDCLPRRGGPSCCARSAPEGRAALITALAATAWTPAPPWTRPRSAACWSGTASAPVPAPTAADGRPAAASPAQRRAAHGPWPTPSPGTPPGPPYLAPGGGQRRPRRGPRRRARSVAEENRARRGFAAASATLERSALLTSRPRPGRRRLAARSGRLPGRRRPADQDAGGQGAGRARRSPRPRPGAVQPRDAGAVRGSVPRPPSCWRRRRPGRGAPRSGRWPNWGPPGSGSTTWPAWPSRATNHRGCRRSPTPSNRCWPTSRGGSLSWSGATRRPGDGYWPTSWSC